MSRLETSPTDRRAATTIQLGFVFSVLLIWTLTTHYNLISVFFLPDPVDVVFALRDVVLSGELWRHFRVTLIELVIAFAINAVAATLIGFAIARSRYSTQVFEPVFAAMFSIPLILFYPVNVLVFGIGMESKIVQAAMFGFFPMVLSTIAGFSTINPQLIRFAKVTGANTRQVLTKIMMPAAMPVLVSGYRMGFMMTFLSIVSAETITSLEGMGNRIVWYAEVLETPKMYAYIVIIIGIAFLMNAVLRYIEERWS